MTTDISATEYRDSGLVALGFLAFVGIVSLLGVGQSTLQLLTLGLVYGLGAMSLDIGYGYGGMLSFGHAALFGTGGYAAGLVMQAGHFDLVLCAVVAVGVGGVMGALWGTTLGRLEGVAFAMGTLALGVSIMFAAQQWRSVLGGTNGIAGLPYPTIFGHDIGSHGLFYIAAACCCGVLVLGRRMEQRWPGLVVRALRDNPVRLRALGHSPFGVRVATQSVVGAVAALGGCLFVMIYGGITPSQLHWSISGLLLVEVLAGGRGTLYGPLVGALVLTVLQARLSSATSQWQLFLGILIVILVLAVPYGLVPAVQRLGIRLHGLVRPAFTPVTQKFERGGADADGPISDSARQASEKPPVRECE